MMAARSKPPSGPPLRLAPAPEPRRRPNVNRRKFSITLPPSVYAALVSYADRQLETTTRIVEIAIVRYLERKGEVVDSPLSDD